MLTSSFTIKIGVHFDNLDEHSLVAKPSILIWKTGHVHHRINFARIIERILLELSNEFVPIIEWILLGLFHKYRREWNAYQGDFIDFCYKLIECIEQNQIYLNFIVNIWKLSNAYTRHRILTHFGNHGSRPTHCPFLY